MLQGILHLAQMRPMEGRLKITSREGMAERQGRIGMKACRSVVGCHWGRTVQQLWMGKQALLICFVFLTDCSSNENIILGVKPIQKKSEYRYYKYTRNVRLTLIHLVIHWINSATYCDYFFFSVSSKTIIMRDGHMNGIFIKQPGLISNLSFWEGSKTVSSLWMSLLWLKYCLP